MIERERAESHQIKHRRTGRETRQTEAYPECKEEETSTSSLDGYRHLHPLSGVKSSISAQSVCVLFANKLQTALRVMNQVGLDKAAIFVDAQLGRYRDPARVRGTH